MTVPTFQNLKFFILAIPVNGKILKRKKSMVFLAVPVRHRMSQFLLYGTSRLSQLYRARGMGIMRAYPTSASSLPLNLLVTKRIYINSLIPKLGVPACRSDAEFVRFNHP